MSKQLVIFGMGDMARMAHHLFATDSDYVVVASCVSKQYLEGDTYLYTPLVAFEEVEKCYPHDQYHMFVAMGYRKVNTLRHEIFLQAKSKGYQLATYKSSRATILSDDIGENTFIFEDNTIQPFVRIGNNVVLWSGNHIGHDATIGDHCFITSHAVISGHVYIGERSFIGVNATIRNNIKIGTQNVIGAGAWISRDTPDFSVYSHKATPQYHKRSDELIDL